MTTATLDHDYHDSYYILHTFTSCLTRVHIFHWTVKRRIWYSWTTNKLKGDNFKLVWIPSACHSREVFLTCPTSSTPRGRFRTYWRDCMPWLVWQHLNLPVWAGRAAGPGEIAWPAGHQLPIPAPTERWPSYWAKVAHHWPIGTRHQRTYSGSGTQFRACEAHISGLQTVFQDAAHWWSSPFTERAMWLLPQQSPGNTHLSLSCFHNSASRERDVCQSRSHGCWYK